MDRGYLIDEILRICPPRRGISIDHGREALQTLGYAELEELCLALQNAERRAQEILAQSTGLEKLIEDAHTAELAPEIEELLARLERPC